MKKKLLSAVMVCALGMVGCGEEEPITPSGPKLDSQANILAFLDGKSIVMEGSNIPSHPNGFSEDVDYGPASQCYQKVTILTGGNTVKVDSVLGTIQNGQCNHDLKKGDLSFTSTAVAIENVATDGSCFDVTFTFPGGVVQEGRGSFAQDRKTLRLELFIKGQATGIRCADGAVGSTGTVKTGNTTFTGNAVQTYVIP